VVIALGVLLVGSLVQQCVELLGVVELDLDHPALVLGALVDELGRLDQGLVDLDDLAADGRVHVAGGLDRLDDAEGGCLQGKLKRLKEAERDRRTALLKGLADVRQLGVDNDAQLVLRVVRDADGADAVVDADPLVCEGVLLGFLRRGFGWGLARLFHVQS